MHSRPDSLILDFDGVLADTEPLYWRAWAELLLPHGIKLTWEEYCRIGRGIRDEDMLPRLPQVASNPALLLSLSQQLASRKETIQTWSSQESPICEPTVKLLRSLSAFPLGLVTSSNRSEVEPVMRAAGVVECFQAMVFGNETSQHKPHPAPYLRIREKLGVPTGFGLVFEDSDAGMESAAAAGLKTIHVDSPANLSTIVQKALDLS